MNNCQLYGRLSKLPVTVSDNNGRDQTIMEIDVIRPFQNIDGVYEFDTFQIKTWKGLSKTILDNCKIGDTLAVTARLSSRVVEEEANNKFNYELIAEHITFNFNYKKSK